MGILYIVATPLGNLEDITLRALRILGEVELIATEDTRTTGRLLKHFNLNCPLMSYHDHSKSGQRERVLQALAEGNVALVSEAGTPLISDPGHRLVQAAIEHGFSVVSIPGPSALLAALPAAGLPLDRFLFLGFLPRKRSARRHLLAEVVNQPATLVCFEAPHRLPDSVGDMVEIFGGERRVAICRELTKLHEEIWRGTLAEAQTEWQARQARGEFTLVIDGAAPPPAWDEAAVKVALADLLAAGYRSKEAARQVAQQSGWSKSELYPLTLQVKKDESNET